MWWKKHGISIVHSKYPIKRRLREGLLLKVQFNILYTILLGVTLREYGIYEPSYGWRQSIRFSWCFSLRSLPSTIPWACWRRMMHHHALSHSRAIGTVLDNDHHHPEPGEAFTQCLRMSSLDFCQRSLTQSCKQTPPPFSRGLFSMNHSSKGGSLGNRTKAWPSSRGTKSLIGSFRNTQVKQQMPHSGQICKHAF